MNYSEVEIYGQCYTVKSDLDDAQLQKLAACVDNKMQELQANTGVISTSRVAILAALNLAEELFQLKHQIETMESVVEEKSSHLLSLIEECKID